MFSAKLCNMPNYELFSSIAVSRKLLGSARFRMVKKIFIIQMLLVCNCPFAVSQEPQKSAGAYSAGVGGSRVKENSGEDVLIATQAVTVKISVRLMKKIHEMEKVAIHIGGQDNSALEKIGAEINKTIALLPMDSELVTAIKDKRFDWRVRYLIMSYKSYTTGDIKVNKYLDDFINIMRDKSEDSHVRGMAALMLVNISVNNSKIKDALKETAKDSDTPGEVLKAVMAVVGYSGVDDADVLVNLTNREPSDFNEVGINLNAIRALGKSKDPRAIGYLVKIFDTSVPDSFYNYTAIVQFWSFIKNPETREQVKPLIIPRFLKLLDDRSPIGASRNEAAAILAELKVQEAVDPILRWFLPANGTSAKVGGGGYSVDVFFGADALVKLGGKRAIPVLEQLILNFANDSRWSWCKSEMEKDGQKFPEDHEDYKHLKKCLEALKKQK